MAFYGCIKLSKIRFNNIKKLKSVGKGAFYISKKAPELKNKMKKKGKMVKYLNKAGIKVLK